MRVRRSDRAFTLIELSIVLVVIGLLVGGVLVGRDLIYAAQLRKVGTELQQLSIAITTFREKYGCLAGDCANASTFLSGTSNGNGDGFVEAWWMGTHNPPSSGLESYYQLQQLSLAGLLPGSYVGGVGPGSVDITSGTGSLLSGRRIPLSSMNPGVGYYPFHVDSGFGGNISQFSGRFVIQVGAYSTASGGDFLWGPGFNAVDSAKIDAKIDDGNPSSGKFFSFSVSAGSNINTNVNCVSGNIYLSSSATGCQSYYIPDVP